jgi:hypothetical protein
MGKEIIPAYVSVGKRYFFFAYYIKLYVASVKLKVNNLLVAMWPSPVARARIHNAMEKNSESIISCNSMTISDEDECLLHAPAALWPTNQPSEVTG